MKQSLGLGVALDLMTSAPGSTLEAQIGEIGRDLHAALPSHSRHPLRALDDKAMDLASRDAELRAALFRLVDVTPACRSLDDLARHLTGYLEEVEDRPQPVEAAMRAGRSAPAGVRSERPPPRASSTWRTASSSATRRGLRLPVLRRLWDSGAASSVDLLGEATVTQAEADRYAARCAEALETLAASRLGVAGPTCARARLRRSRSRA